MGTFRRVDPEHAGPQALGILVPPGKRTFVILRPRALPVDVVLCREANDLTFAQLTHDEASAAAQGLFRALREWSAGGSGTIAAEHTCWHVQVGTFSLVVCSRVPGQPYAPLAPNDAALPAQLEAVLHPPAGREQELYFNVRFFER